MADPNSIIGIKQVGDGYEMAFKRVTEAEGKAFAIGGVSTFVGEAAYILAEQIANPNPDSQDKIATEQSQSSYANQPLGTYATNNSHQLPETANLFTPVIVGGLALMALTHTARRVRHRYKEREINREVARGLARIESVLNIESDYRLR